MKLIALIGMVISVSILLVGCSPISKEEAIDKAYSFVQTTCDTYSNAVRAPKSAYKADKPNDTWLITIEGAFSSRFAVGIVTIEDNPDFGKPHFTASFEMLDYDCGRGWRYSSKEERVPAPVPKSLSHRQGEMDRFGAVMAVYDYVREVCDPSSVFVVDDWFRRGIYDSDEDLLRLYDAKYTQIKGRWTWEVRFHGSFPHTPKYKLKGIWEVDKDTRQVSWLQHITDFSVERGPGSGC